MLELGGNAACIVDEDTGNSEDLDDAVERIIFGAYYQSGQSCIGVQRIMVHESLYDEFKKRFSEKVSKLIMGDPKNESTFVGPMISLSEANRLKAWIDEAVELGGNLLAGGKQDGAMLDATLIENVPRSGQAQHRRSLWPSGNIKFIQQLRRCLKKCQ